MPRGRLSARAVQLVLGRVEGHLPRGKLTRGCILATALLGVVAWGSQAAATASGAEPDSLALAQLARVTMATSYVAPRAAARTAGRAADARDLPPHFAFLYADPLGERVDTVGGTVTKWLGAGRDTTIALRLSNVEIAVVYEKMQAIRYFQLPTGPSRAWWWKTPPRLHTLPLDALQGRGDWVQLDARVDTTIQRVQWPWYVRFDERQLEVSDDMLRIQELVNLIWFEVAKHDEYRALPDAKWSSY